VNPAAGSSAHRCPRTTGSCVPAIPDGIGGLVFDFDGTLADTTTSHEQALRAALHPYGLELDSTWYRGHLGLSINDLLAAIPGGRNLPHDVIIQRSRTRLLDAVDTITPVPCVVSLLRAARAARLPCAVASGASHLLVQPGIDALGLRDDFAVVVAREDVTRGKPAPDLLATAARRLGLPPQRCLAIDDAPDGITAARAAGMRVITVIGGHLASADEARENAEQPDGSKERHARPALDQEP
jgi:beta-phosphoglucomutase-like phosphatase (HAD superfamily)